MHKDDSLSTSSVEDPQNICKSILNDILSRLSLGPISTPSSIVTLFVPNRNLLSMALALPLPPFAGPLHVDLCKTIPLNRLTRKSIIRWGDPLLFTCLYSPAHSILLLFWSALSVVVKARLKHAPSSASSHAQGGQGDNKWFMVSFPITTHQYLPPPTTRRCPPQPPPLLSTPHHPSHSPAAA